MSQQSLLDPDPPTPATPMTEFLAGQLAHAAGVRKATDVQRKQLERIAADAIAAARRVIRP